MATQLGRELKVPMRMANLALDELTEALNRGWGDRDSRVAMLLQQERAGVKIEVARGRSESRDRARREIAAAAVSGWRRVACSTHMLHASHGEDNHAARSH